MVTPIENWLNRTVGREGSGNHIPNLDSNPSQEAAINLMGIRAAHKRFIESRATLLVQKGFIGSLASLTKHIGSHTFAIGTVVATLGAIIQDPATVKVGLTAVAVGFTGALVGTIVERSESEKVTDDKNDNEKK